jgi:hypothetical protein
MLESNIRFLKNFVNFLIIIIGILIVICLYEFSKPLNNKCLNDKWKYQPEVSWYSGPIGYNCGCK